MSTEERAKRFINQRKAYKRKNQFSKAVQCFGEALKLVEKVKGTKQETTAYLELGDCYKLSHIIEIKLIQCSLLAATGQFCFLIGQKIEALP